MSRDAGAAAALGRDRRPERRDDSSSSSAVSRRVERVPRAVASWTEDERQQVRRNPFEVRVAVRAAAAFFLRWPRRRLGQVFDHRPADVAAPIPFHLAPLLRARPVPQGEVPATGALEAHRRARGEVVGGQGIEADEAARRWRRGLRRLRSLLCSCSSVVARASPSSSEPEDPPEGRHPRQERG